MALPKSANKRGSDAKTPPSRSKKRKVSMSEEPEDADAVTVTRVTTPEKKRSEEGDPYWELSDKRRVMIQNYKGMTLVGLREYYEKDGKLLPGKQGLSLKVEQFQKLVLAVDGIKRELEKRGHAFEESQNTHEDTTSKQEARKKSDPSKQPSVEDCTDEE